MELRFWKWTGDDRRLVRNLENDQQAKDEIKDERQQPVAVEDNDDKNKVLKAAVRGLQDHPTFNFHEIVTNFGTCSDLLARKTRTIAH